MAKITAKINPKKKSKKNQDENDETKPKKNSKKDSVKDKRILEVKTTQTGALKQAFERISNVISDCCLVFIPPDDLNRDPDNDYYEEIDIGEPVSKKKIVKKSNKIKEEENEDEEGKFKKKKIISKKNKKIEEDDDEDEEEKPKKKKIISKKNKEINEDGEEDEDLESLISKKNNKKRMSKSKIIESDADDEEKPLKKNGKNKKNTGGLSILRLTEDKSILIKLNLDAINFEYFRCDEPKITIGVDMHNLHALLKSGNDDDPIILYMNT